MANTKLVIQRVMEEKGVTLTELASRLPGRPDKEGNPRAMSKGALSAMLSEGNFTLKSLEKIADALGVEVVDLFERSEEVPSNGFVEIGGKRYKVTLTPEDE